MVAPATYPTSWVSSIQKNLLGASLDDQRLTNDFWDPEELPVESFQFVCSSTTTSSHRQRPRSFALVAYTWTYELLNSRDQPHNFSTSYLTPRLDLKLLQPNPIHPASGDIFPPPPPKLSPPTHQNHHANIHHPSQRLRRNPLHSHNPPRRLQNRPLQQTPQHLLPAPIRGFSRREPNPDRNPRRKSRPPPRRPPKSQTRQCLQARAVPRRRPLPSRQGAPFVSHGTDRLLRYLTPIPLPFSGVCH